MMYTSKEACMIRTQIYLDAAQKSAMEKLANKNNKSLAQMIRSAIEVFLKYGKDKTDDVLLDESFGIWKDMKEDGPAYTKRLRKEWDR